MKILVLGTLILAVDPQDSGDQWETVDQIIPKHVVPGAAIVDAELPEDYAPGRYTYDVGFVRVPAIASPPVVPESVSMRQARLALLGVGLLDTVNSAVVAMPGEQGAAARIEWEYARDVRRDSPLVLSLAGPLNLSAEHIDALFVAAGAL